jgi:hypothetical protein
VEYIHLLEIVMQVLALVGTEKAQGQADQGPHVNHAVVSAVVLAELMDLGVAVVTSGNAVIGLGGLDLLILELAEGQALIFIAGLEEPAATAAAVVIGPVGLHVDEVLLAHHRLDHEPEVLGNGITVGFPDDLTGVLDRELDPEILVPVGIDLELTLANPLGVVFVDVLDDEVVLDVEFFQSCQD